VQEVLFSRCLLSTGGPVQKVPVGCRRSCSAGACWVQEVLFRRCLCAQNRPRTGWTYWTGPS